VKLGDGMLCEPNNGVLDFEISPEFWVFYFNDPIKVIILGTYPHLLENYNNGNFL